MPYRLFPRCEGPEKLPPSSFAAQQNDARFRVLARVSNSLTVGRNVATIAAEPFATAQKEAQ